MTRTSLGLCRVVEVGPPHRLAPGEGDLDPTGPQPIPSRLGPHPAIYFAEWSHASAYFDASREDPHLP